MTDQEKFNVKVTALMSCGEVVHAYTLLSLGEIKTLSEAKREGILALWSPDGDVVVSLDMHSVEALSFMRCG